MVKHIIDINHELNNVFITETIIIVDVDHSWTITIHFIVMALITNH